MPLFRNALSKMRDTVRTARNNVRTRQSAKTKARQDAKQKRIETRVKASQKRRRDVVSAINKTKDSMIKAGVPGKLESAGKKLWNISPYGRIEKAQEWFGSMKGGSKALTIGLTVAAIGLVVVIGGKIFLKSSTGGLG